MCIEHQLKEALILNETSWYNYQRQENCWLDYYNKRTIDEVEFGKWKKP